MQVLGNVDRKPWSCAFLLGTATQLIRDSDTQDNGNGNGYGIKKNTTHSNF